MTARSLTKKKLMRLWLAFALTLAAVTARAGAEVGVNSRVAELIVASLLFFIGQNLVSLVDLLELLFRGLVAGVKVGVVLFGLLSVRFFYIIVARALVEPEHLVIISFICHWIHSFLQLNLPFGNLNLASPS